MIQDDDMQTREIKGVFKTDTDIFGLDFEQNYYIEEEIKIIIAQMYFV